MKKMYKIVSLIIVCLIVILIPQTNYVVANAETTSELVTTKHYNNTVSAEERQLRDTVVDYMYQMGSILWTTPQNIDTQCVEGCTDANCNTPLVVGTIYRGLPYKHSSSTLDRMGYCLNNNNSLKQWVVDLGPLGGFQTYFGSACYSSIQLAWARVSNTVNASCAMEALLYGDKVGVLGVGNWSSAWTTKTDDQYSQICFDKLGIDAILEDYALVKAGDAFIRVGAQGAHAIMAAEDAVVVRDKYGYIDTTNSYVITHEQGGPSDAPSGVVSSWCLNRKQTFASLVTQFFLPVTIRELAEGHMDTVTVDIHDDLDGEYGLTTGIITSNFYIDAVTIDIKENGSDFFNKKVYCRVDNIKDYDGTVAMFDRNFVKEYDLALFSRSLQDVNFDDTKDYHATITVLLQTGDSRLVKELDF